MTSHRAGSASSVALSMSATLSSPSPSPSPSPSSSRYSVTKPSPRNSEHEERVRSALRELRERNVSLEHDIIQLEKLVLYRSCTSSPTSAKAAPPRSKTMDKNLNALNSLGQPRSSEQRRSASQHGCSYKSLPPTQGLLSPLDATPSVRVDKVRSRVEGRLAGLLRVHQKLLFEFIDLASLKPEVHFLCTPTAAGGSAADQGNVTGCLDANGNQVVIVSADQAAETALSSIATASNPTGVVRVEEPGNLSSFVVIGPRHVKKKSHGSLRLGDQIVSIDSSLVADLVVDAVREQERFLHSPPSYYADTLPPTATTTTTCAAAAIVAASLFHRLTSRSSPTAVVLGIIRDAASSSGTVTLTAKMALIGDWTQIQVVHLTNETSGLGFGIVGGASTGVVIKTILPGSVADKDGRLRPGDRILQIGCINVQGMSSQQVAGLLRQPEPVIEIIVGRPTSITETVNDSLSCWTMATRAALNPVTLEEQIQQRIKSIQNGSLRRESSGTSGNTSSTTGADAVADGGAGVGAGIGVGGGGGSDDAPVSQHDHLPPPPIVKEFPPTPQATTPQTPVSEQGNSVDRDVSPDDGQIPSTSTDHVKSPDTENDQAKAEVSKQDSSASANRPDSRDSKVSKSKSALTNLTNSDRPISLKSLQEMALTTFCRENWAEGTFEEVVVELQRDAKSGLGITVAGYVHKKEEITGVFVKSLVPNSPAHLSKKIQVHDLIIDVNGTTLEGLSHAESVRTLVKSGNNVRLTMIRFAKDTNQAVCLKLLHEQETDTQVVDVQSTLLDYKTYWQNRLGQDYEVITVIIRPDHNDSDGGLGLSLEGTVDVIDGTQLCPHHYVESMRKDGPASKLAVIKGGDELLQVNDVVLYGESHVTVRQALSRAVSLADQKDVRLTLCRKVQQINLYMPSPEQSLPLAYTLLASEGQDRIVKAKSESSINLNNTEMGHFLSEVSRKLRSRSLEHLSGLAIWNCVPIVVTLEKDSRGLGFSIVDYQDPMHPHESVIVIRSLVPGGVAQADGRIVPGDRLLFVNSTDLSRSTLDHAVEVLKSAPPGLVRLGIAKPVPVDQIRFGAHSPIISRSERLLAKGSSPRTRRRRLQYAESQQSSNEEVWIGADVYRHLNPQSHSSMLTWSPCSSRSLSPCGSPVLLRGSWGYDVTYLPRNLERSIKIIKGPLPLGIVVDAEADKGINGCVVKSICSKKAIGRDGRIQAGDYLVRVNSENLRNVANSQAKAILKRANLIGTQCNVTYITAADARLWKQRYQREDNDSETQIVSRLSPKVFPKFYQNPVFTPHANPPDDDSTRVPSSEMLPTESTSQLCDNTSSFDDDDHTHEEFSESRHFQFEKSEAPKSKQTTTPPVSPDNDTLPEPPPEVMVPRQEVEDRLRKDELAQEKEDEMEGERFVWQKASAIVDDVFISQFVDDLLRCVLADALLELKTSFAIPEDWSSPSHRPCGGVHGDQPGQQQRRLIEDVPFHHDDDGGDEPLTHFQTPVTASTSAASTNRPDSSASTITETNSIKRGDDSQRPSTTLTMEPADGPATAPPIPPKPPSTCSSTTSIASKPRKRTSYWGEARTVVLHREPNESFGISIVGGRVEVSQKGGLPGTGNTVTGIFIKSVLPESPAGRSGQMFMGDRVISVNDVDLKDATHEYAVQVIKGATNPVKFVVQSLQSFNVHHNHSSGTEEHRQKVEIVHNAPSESEEKENKNTAVNETPPNPNPPTTPTVETPSTPKDKEQQQQPPPEKPVEKKRSSKKLFRRLSKLRESMRKKLDSESAAALHKDPDDDEEEDRFCYTEKKIQKKYADLPGKPTIIRLEGIPPKGLGFSVTNDLENSPGGSGGKKKSVFVVDITSTSPLPLQMGDELLEINGKVLFGLSDSSATKKIRECCEGDELALLILRKPEAEKDDTQPSSTSAGVDENLQIASGNKGDDPSSSGGGGGSSVVSPEGQPGGTGTGSGNGAPGAKDHHHLPSPGHHSKLSPHDSAKSPVSDGPPGTVPPLTPTSTTSKKSNQQMERTAQIETGVETVIEIDKDGKGLGLSIVGGSDTVLGTVVIHEIYSDGAAAMDGRLKPGDQILEVNGYSLRAVSHEQAISVLRRTPAKVRFVIYRDVNLQLSLLDPTQIYNIFTIELTKKPGRGLGISIVGRKNEPGVYVSEIVKGGVADSDGRLMQSDQILAVNTQDVTNSMQEDVATMLKTCTGRVTLKIGRWKLTETANRVHAAQPPSLSPQLQRVNNNNNNNNTNNNNTAAAAAATTASSQSPSAGTSAPTNNGAPLGHIGPTPTTPRANHEDFKMPSVSISPLPSPGGGYAKNGLREERSDVPPPAPPSRPMPEVKIQDENQVIVYSDLSPVSEEPGSQQDLKSLAEQSDSSTVIPPPSPSPLPSNEITLVPDLHEEGSDDLLITLKKAEGQQWGMGIGKRARGILITSLQPGSTAAEKLKVGDRIMAVNAEAVTDQHSAVTYVKASGNQVALQIARPITRPSSGST